MLHAPSSALFDLQRVFFRRIIDVGDMMAIRYFLNQRRTIGASKIHTILPQNIKAFKSNIVKLSNNHTLSAFSSDIYTFGGGVIKENGDYKFSLTW